MNQSVRNSLLADKKNARKHVFNGKRSVTPTATNVGRSMEFKKPEPEAQHSLDNTQDISQDRRSRQDRSRKREAENNPPTVKLDFILNGPKKLQAESNTKNKFHRARTPNGLGVKIEFPERVRSKSPIHVTEVVLTRPIDQPKPKKISLFQTIAEKEILNKAYS